MEKQETSQLYFYGPCLILLGWFFIQIMVIRGWLWPTASTVKESVYLFCIQQLCYVTWKDTPKNPWDISNYTIFMVCVEGIFLEIVGMLSVAHIKHSCSYKKIVQ